MIFNELIRWCKAPEKQRALQRAGQDFPCVLYEGTLPATWIRTNVKPIVTLTKSGRVSIQTPFGGQYPGFPAVHLSTNCHNQLMAETQWHNPFEGERHENCACTSN